MKERKLITLGCPCKAFNEITSTKFSTSEIESNSSFNFFSATLSPEEMSIPSNTSENELPQFV
jgi:hypothetical protein